MPRALLFSLPEHAALHALLRTAGLEDVVWAVLGGVPAHYTALHDKLRRAAPKDTTGLVERYLDDQLRFAISRLNGLEPHSSLMPVLDDFRLADEVAESRLRDVVSPALNMVLRSVVSQGGKATVYVPADSAMALVLRHRFKVVPALGELQALCAGKGLPPTPSSGKVGC